MLHFINFTFFNFSLVVSPSDGRCDVCLLVFKAVHCRGDVQTTPGFLQATPQQQFWLFWPVPASRCKGSWTQSLRYLQWSIRPNEFKLPCPSQVSWLWSDVLIALLKLQMHISDIWDGESSIASSWRCCAGMALAPEILCVWTLFTCLWEPSVPMQVFWV